MKKLDDENTDEWNESYDSCDADMEFDADGVFMKPAAKFNSKKRIAFTENNNEDFAESDELGRSSESELETENQNEKFKLKSNTAWADAMAKILRSKKTIGKKSIVLSKAKKLSDVKAKKRAKLDFEIVGAPEEKSDSDEKEEKKPVLTKTSTLKDYQTRGRVKPSILDKDREKKLMKIATKGVVQLFNAVRQQQKTVDKTLKTPPLSLHKLKFINEGTCEK